MTHLRTPLILWFAELGAHLFSVSSVSECSQSHSAYHRSHTATHIYAYQNITFLQQLIMIIYHPKRCNGQRGVTVACKSCALRAYLFMCTRMFAFCSVCGVCSLFSPFLFFFFLFKSGCRCSYLPTDQLLQFLSAPCTIEWTDSPVMDMVYGYRVAYLWPPMQTANMDKCVHAVWYVCHGQLDLKIAGSQSFWMIMYKQKGATYMPGPGPWSRDDLWSHLNAGNKIVQSNKCNRGDRGWHYKCYWMAWRNGMLRMQCVWCGMGYTMKYMVGYAKPSMSMMWSMIGMYN